MAIEAFKEEQPGLTIEYPGGGSGNGRQNLQDGVVDFAGSDGLVKDEDKPKYKGEFLYFPTVAAPITVSYNLDVDDLVLDADTIAKIFQRQITKWDDAAIKALNPDANLPSTDIVVAHRSDGSGTTENFTKYLVAAAPNTWTLKSGSTVEWPADTQAGNGNAGVATIVKDTPGAIGYVDLSDAKATGLKFATIVNKAGKKVEPTLDAASAALAGATINADLSYNPLNADGDGVLPDHRPDLDPRVHEPDRQGQGRRHQGLPHLHPHRRPGPGQRRRLRRAARQPAGRRPWPRSTRSSFPPPRR